ncbi:hypothetical protein G9A89_007109 [Geosiphon pyriformis]|nr:hypothetical protein G9A89_007109 [Geosiphon pyriformis]
MTNVYDNKKKGLGIAKAVSVHINDISIKTDIKISETTSPVFKQNQEKEQLDESNNNESDKKKNQEEQKETVKLIYTIFTSNGKPLDNVKANKKEIILIRKQNTVIGDMVLVSNAGVINLCIPLVMNASPV